MTGLLFILALLDFWAGVILTILSAVGVISTPIWLILLITISVFVILIISVYFISIKEYGDYTDEYVESSENDIY